MSVRVHGQSPGGGNGEASQRDRHLETCSIRYGLLLRGYTLPSHARTEGARQMRCALLCLHAVMCPIIVTGGLYEATRAPQGKGGSSMDVMSPAKLRITGDGE